MSITYVVVERKLGTLTSDDDDDDASENARKQQF